MKIHLHLLIAFLMLAVIAIPASAIDYTISFTASGAATTVTNVEVQNLTQNTSAHPCN